MDERSRREDGLKKCIGLVDVDRAVCLRPVGFIVMRDDLDPVVLRVRSNVTGFGHEHSARGV